MRECKWACKEKCVFQEKYLYQFSKSICIDQQKMFVLIFRKRLSYFVKKYLYQITEKYFLLISRKYLYQFAKSISIKLQKIFALICRKCLYYLAKCICISLQKVFLQIAKSVWIFFSKSICISLQKVFPLFQRSQLHVVQCRLSRSSLWKNFGIKRLLVRHFDSQFPPEL